MSNIIEAENVFSDHRHQQDTEKIIETINQMWGDAERIVEEFEKLLAQDQNQAIDRLPEFIKKARAINKCPESMCGGPNSDWIIPLMNPVGDIYRQLSIESRTTFLRRCLQCFDGLNYVYVQPHVKRLDQSLLVTDIMVNRPIYYPGFSEELDYLGSHPTAADIIGDPAPNLKTFWMGLAVMWADDHVSLPVRHWFYQTYPDLIEKALDLAALIVFSSANKRAKSSDDFENQVTIALNKKLDLIVHDQVKEKIESRNWIIIPR